MSMTTMMREFVEGSIQMEAIIHLGSMCHDADRWSDIALEAFMEDSEAIWEALGIDAPEDEDDLEMITEKLTDEGIDGFLVKVATPVPKDVRDGSWSLSWGSYTTEWLFAESYEECCKQAIDWRNALIKRRTKAE